MFLFCRQITTVTFGLANVNILKTLEISNLKEELSLGKKEKRLWGKMPNVRAAQNSKPVQ
jgi:hypothetical protein